MTSVPDDNVRARHAAAAGWACKLIQVNVAKPTSLLREFPEAGEFRRRMREFTGMIARSDRYCHRLIATLAATAWLASPIGSPAIGAQSNAQSGNARGSAFRPSPASGDITPCGSPQQAKPAEGPNSFVPPIIDGPYRGPDLRGEASRALHKTACLSL